jgi:hypothetical protein
VTSPLKPDMRSGPTLEQVARLRELLKEAKVGDGREEVETILADMARSLTFDEAPEPPK